MADEDIKESAVEVTLPDDPITEIAVDTAEPTITEPKADIKPVKEKAPEVDDERAPAPEVDEREIALKNLKAQYEYQKQLAAAEREARLRAEQYAQQQAQHVQSAQNEVQDSNLRVITNAIAATQQQADAAEHAYAEAMAAGDYAAAAKAQRAIAQAESHLLQLENGKARLEESLAQPAEGRVEAPKIPDFAPKLPKDPVEMYAERLSPKSAAWLRNNPEVVDRIPRLSRAHEDALEDGLVAESPEYFAFIESRLGISRDRVAETPRDVPPPSRKTMASTPVSTAGTSLSGASTRSPNSMVLSAAEVEMAILAEPTLPRDKAIESYARNKALLIKQGKLSA